MWQLACLWQSLASTSKQSRTMSFWRFRAALKHPLHADTNSKEGNLMSNAFFDCRLHARVREYLCRCEVSNAWEDDLGGDANPRWITGDLVGLPEPIECLFYRDKISCAVIDDCNHYNSPFVEGRSRFIRRSRQHAALIARAKALK